MSNRIISFTFDQRMLTPGNYGVTWSNFGLTASSILWSSDKKTIYFVYSTDLPAGRTIGWVLNPSTHPPRFKSETGVPLPPDQYSGSFSTTSTPTPTQFTIEASVQHYHPENYFLGITVNSIPMPRRVLEVSPKWSREAGISDLILKKRMHSTLR